ncbi:hypothetical protein ASPZODRAFT_12909 [Penicilliopsis zonata CBS 506.65]|uniref:Uncharacterized protein n=1 Tax=Penicilliopsis zonata CBS 506.65 TaxID=1073090 RepID=A0A1L9SRG4_9EURO|nr:hypothetical protein ASPZODRAFT_12909 [Penicilliopsis zonata CBS 506.65]OJJ49795.1 hypothetical protein ASPZODRAFT_12909 [Penicilliopsis zonata CBS 506.65]
MLQLRFCWPLLYAVHRSYLQRLSSQPSPLSSPIHAVAQDAQQQQQRRRRQKVLVIAVWAAETGYSKRQQPTRVSGSFLASSSCERQGHLALPTKFPHRMN